MSKVDDYKIKIHDCKCFLAKEVPSLEEKGMLSQDKRELTPIEILTAFRCYFEQYCNDNRTNVLRIYKGRKLVFEARRPRRKKKSTTLPKL